MEALDGDLQRQISGQIIAGATHQFEDHMITFDAKTSYRMTEPWTGDRVVLVAHTVIGVQNMSADDRVFADFLGFKLPIIKREALVMRPRIGTR